MGSDKPELKSSGRSEKAKILVVDNEPSLLTLLSKYLEPVYEVWTTASAREAIRQVTAAPPDLALVDLYMPEMDGFEFIMALHQLHALVPVIAMSGGGAWGDMSPLGAAKYMVTSVLAKPFSRAQLLSTVEDVLRKP